MEKFTNKMSNSLNIPIGSNERFLYFAKPQDISLYEKAHKIIGGISNLKENYWVNVPCSNLLEMVYCIDGSFTYEYNEIKGIVSPNELIILPPGERHAYYSDTPFKMIWFHIGTTTELFTKNTHIHQKRLAKYSREIIHLSELLYLEEQRFWQNSHDFNSNFISCTGILINYLQLELAENNLKEQHRQSIEEAFMRVDRNLSYDWTIPKLAKLAKLSESHFYALVKEYYQTTPLQIIRTKRLSAANIMRNSSKMTLNRIAEIVGYSDGYALSKSLKKFNK